MVSSEMFPANYEVYRKDRNLRGGGVILLVSRDLSSTPLEFRDCICESVWCKIKLRGLTFLTVGSFYRPPGNNALDPLLCSSNTLSAITPDDVILSGDFNLPDIDCVENIPNLRNSLSLYTTFDELINTHELQQFVSLRTRYSARESILDLFFTNRPSSVSSVMTTPGLSDHEVVVTHITCKRDVVIKSRPKKVYFFYPDDYDSLSFDLLAFLPEFECSCTSLDIEDLWLLFKSVLMALIDKYGPCKMLSGRRRHDKPWINKSLRCLLNKKRRLFLKYIKKKKPGNEK